MQYKTVTLTVTLSSHDNIDITDTGFIDMVHSTFTEHVSNADVCYCSCTSDCEVEVVIEDIEILKIE